MPLSETAYNNLEQRFRDQVLMDRSRLIQWVVKKGLGVYLPCKKPSNKVDYIFVGMEPSFGWAKSVEDGEKKVKAGAMNYGACTPPDDAEHPLDLLRLAIGRFLCQPGETYYLTDVSKGAMPVAVAGIEREQRYRDGYPLLLDEIDIVGKPGAPIIAIGKKVQEFLQRQGLEKKACRSLHAVMHYSNLAARHWNTEAEQDPEGFKAFEKEEFGRKRRWARNLSTAKMQLIFTYKKQFNAIRCTL